MALHSEGVRGWRRRMPLGSEPGVKGTQNTGIEGSPQAQESTPGPSALSGACRRHGGGDGGLPSPGHLSVLFYCVYNPHLDSGGHGSTGAAHGFKARWLWTRTRALPPPSWVSMGK